LHGYLSGAEVPEAGGAESSVGSVREFEQRLDGMALGIAYRDVLYCLASQHGARAELGGEGLRVVTRSKPTRVLATIEVTRARRLRVVLLAGALTARGGEHADEYELRPAESADRVVDQIGALLGVQEKIEIGGTLSGASP
jgi:hypothetical protein